LLTPGALQMRVCSACSASLRACAVETHRIGQRQPSGAECADGACRWRMPTASPRCRCGIGEPRPSAGVGAQRMWQASADIPEAAWCGPIYISINLYIYLYLYIYIYLSIYIRHSRRTGSPRCLRYAHTPRRHSASLHAAAPECSEIPPLTLTEYAEHRIAQRLPHAPASLARSLARRRTEARPSHVGRA
jgi:hypothetical protein